MFIPTDLLEKRREVLRFLFGVVSFRGVLTSPRAFLNGCSYSWRIRKDSFTGRWDLVF